MAAAHDANNFPIFWPNADITTVDNRDYVRMHVNDKSTLDGGIPPAVNRVLRVRYPKDTLPASTGVQFDLKVTPQREYFYSYRVRVPATSYLSMGLHLPGVSGGSIGSSACTIPNGTDCVADRLAVSAEGHFKNAVNHPEAVGPCGEPLLWHWDGQTTITADRWHIVEGRIRLNTVGRSDS